MANIGSLAVQLIMNREGFTGGLQAAQKESEAFVNNIRKTLTQQKLMGDLKEKLKAEMNPPGLLGTLRAGIGGMGIGGAAAAVGIPLGIGAAGSFIKSGLEGVVKQGKDAERYGISMHSVATFTRLAGAETEKFENGLGKLVEAIGKTRSGSREYLPVLRQLGISQREFVGMRADTAYVRVAEGIQKLGNAGERSAAAQQLMGKAGDDLLSILLKQRGGWDAAAASVNQYNAAFTRAEFEQARIAQESLKNAEFALEVAKQRFSVKASPLISAATEQTPPMTWSQMLNPFDLSMMERYLKRVEEIKKGVGAQAAKPDTSKAEALADAIKALDTKFEEQSRTAGMSARQIEIWKLHVGGASGAALQNVSALDAQLTALEKLNATTLSGLNIFEAFKAKMDAIDRGMMSGTITQAQRTSEQAKFTKELEATATNRAWQMFGETRTPLEQFQSRLAELDQLHKSNTIDANLHARGLSNLVKEMEKAANIGPVQSPSALVSGSSAAADAMAQFRNESRTRGQSQQERVATLLSELVNQGKMQSQQAQELIQAFKDMAKPQVLKVP